MHTIQNLWNIDLNLLVVLDVLLRERSVTRAARRLNRTPSAISHALGRLREVFGDELLVREGQGMRPTARASALAAVLPEALGQVVRAIANPRPFDFATSDRTFRLAVPDFAAPIVPLLLERLASEAPGVRVVFQRLSPDALTDVATGRCDGVIALSSPRDGLRGEPLGTWPWRVYARAGHPAFDAWSAQAWAAYSHVMVGIGLGGRGPISLQAERLGIERTVGAVVPNFSMVSSVLVRTDLLFTGPSVAMHDAAADGLDSREVPFDLPPMGLSMFRSAVDGNEPGVEWFLERVGDAMRVTTHVA
ncbi:MAG: LysR family transcriptional regulator [Myxococcales bacterium]|nr:LysR family transcriptional regulator [Myxococcales bacterium]